MKDKDFNFKKQFGQNFIFDKNFLNSLVEGFDLPKDINVLEIGAGMGTLSTTLASHYSRVLSYEIDKTLTEHLRSLESDNLKFVFKDILKQDIGEIESYFGGKEYYMIANLPYYITSQIIFKFLFDSSNLKSMFVMVQKEVGERFCAGPGGKDYGIPSVLLATFADCKIVKNVSRKMFVPQPNVDSCIIRIDLQKVKYAIKSAQKYSDFVSKCFQMKRKTLMNNLAKMGLDKERCIDALQKLSIALDSRPEMLGAEQYVKLFDLLS